MFDMGQVVAVVGVVGFITFVAGYLCGQNNEHMRNLRIREETDKHTREAHQSAATEKNILGQFKNEIEYRAPGEFVMKVTPRLAGGHSLPIYYEGDCYGLVIVNLSEQSYRQIFVMVHNEGLGEEGSYFSSDKTGIHLAIETALRYLGE